MRRRTPLPTRRGLLRGVLAGGAVTVSLPWLELFWGRQAMASTCGDSGFPRRFVVWMWGNGTRPDTWVPEQTGSDYVLTNQLSPLAPLQSKITVVTGLSVKVPNDSPHWSGAVGFLTGQELTGDDNSWDVAVPTVDQIVANAIGGDTLYRSLQVGVNTDSCVSFSGPTARNYGDNDPYVLYERLFGATFRDPGDGGIVDPALGYRRSALDAVMGDIGTLQSQLGAADQARLDQHLTGVREIELRLARLQEDPPDLAACSRPEEPIESYPDVDGRPQFLAKNAVISDLSAMALACDQTRVLFVQFTRPLSSALFPQASDGHHSLTHNEGGDQPECEEITRHCMENFSAFLQSMDNIDEGEGTLLDNAVVLGTSEISEGRTHSLEEFPFILAGGGCGRLPMGQHIRSFSQDNANKATLSVLRALDVPVAEFGDGESLTQDGLGELEI